MNDPIHPVLRRYVQGEVSALRAAAEMGDHWSVSDVIAAIMAAGLQPPRQSPEREEAELERARRILGLR